MSWCIWVIWDNVDEVYLIYDIAYSRVLLGATKGFKRTKCPFSKIVPQKRTHAPMSEISPVYIHKESAKCVNRVYDVYEIVSMR